MTAVKCDIDITMYSFLVYEDKEVGTCYLLDLFEGLLVSHFVFSKEQLLKFRLNTLVVLNLFLHI